MGVAADVGVVPGRSAAGKAPHQSLRAGAAEDAPWEEGQAAAPTGPGRWATRPEDGGGKSLDEVQSRTVAFHVHPHLLRARLFETASCLASVPENSHAGHGAAGRRCESGRRPFGSRSIRPGRRRGRAWDGAV